MALLFEASWEVCNKVGGINTVICSKVPQACKAFGDDYFLLGPSLDDNAEFQEENDPRYTEISRALKDANLSCKLGRWQIPHQPRVVLVDFRDHYNVDKLLYSYWQDFGVDSYAGRWDYIEPVLFATACGEVIHLIYKTIANEGDRAVAHFHEWMMGAGLLYLKKHLPEIGTVFTTHATMLGRAMASSGRDLYGELANINPLDEAKVIGVSAKHSMEKVAAREADTFTTVSKVTAEEAGALLEKYPDRVVANGFNISSLPDYSVSRTEPDGFRKKLNNLTEKFLQKKLPPTTQFWLTSGRYEFHNKGYDAFLESLSRIDEELRQLPNVSPVVAFFLIAVGHRGVQEAVHRRVHENEKTDNANVGIVTHRLYDEQNDPIIRTCYDLQLRNSPENKANIIFCPAYLDGHDGIFNMPYENILSACDLGVFPSYYEPWGYTPLESIAYSVPTVTTDLAGFGQWASDLGLVADSGVYLLGRRECEYHTFIETLTQTLSKFAGMSKKNRALLSKKTRETALRAEWEEFFLGYQAAYDDAIVKAQRRFDIATLDSTSAAKTVFTTFKGALHSETPHYRPLTAVSTLSKKIAKLQEIAYNLWWSWNHEARELFQMIDDELWKRSDYNPVQLLNQVPTELLEQKSEDPEFFKKYGEVVRLYDDYINDKRFDLETHDSISPEHPVAYFSMEYGLRECLPIYSGGLGILSGDHLKSASDLNIPLIGIGLFYRQGYFTQSIDREGNQKEHFPRMDYSMLPIKRLNTNQGKKLRVSVELPGRTLYAKVWQVNVGRVKLYLMDSDVEENQPEDRQLTHQLYGGSRRRRLEQEILLGIGGVRLVKDVLEINPSVYHLNEGHVAFLLLERMKNFIKAGLTSQEAREAVAASSVFTTHTPVPAGNETFEPQVIQHCLGSYVEQLGVDWEEFLELGHDARDEIRKEFSMTVFALKLSSRANGVSKLHGKVCRDMWKSVWPNMDVEEVPIFHITNGVHLQTWISRSMHQLLSKACPIEWGRNEDDPAVWEPVKTISDEEFWNARQRQKKRLVDNVKKNIAHAYANRGEDPQFIRDTLQSLRSDVLFIGFARRFASYKRATLILKDRERLGRLLNDPERPLVLLFAGKAHPADSLGKSLINEVLQASHSDAFRGKLIYIENYNMGIGRLLTRGVDVWLNTPRRPHEASGTSGMKVGPNGGLNMSVMDGWWNEAFRADIGWQLKADAEYKSHEHQDEKFDLHD